MSILMFVGAESAERLRVGPLAAHIDAYAADLREKGYPAKTAYERLSAVAGMSRWLERRGLGAADLTTTRVAEYVREWRSPGRAPRGRPKALRDLVDQLRREGVVPPEPVPDDPVSRVVLAFEEYLLRERGFGTRTLPNYLPFARLLLVERFGDGPVALDALLPRDVVEFQLRHVRTMGRERARTMVSALRSFLRFLLLRGDVAVDLSACIQPVAQWRLSGVPTWIEARDVRRILDACDRRTPKGLRDFAILLTLSRLGLRAGEIVRMRLEDLRWEAGEIVVRGKGARIDRLPLPRDVGAALVAYLRRGRPRCAAREVFLRARAPHRGLAWGPSLTRMVERAIDRVGLAPRHKGPHILRHSLATHMLARGATLREIGEVLRHRRVQTTQIYAKVDMAALRSVALAWPRGGR